MNRFCAELRTEVRGERVEGHAAIFDQHAEIRGAWEAIAASAFDVVLRSEPDVVALINHDPKLVLDRTKSGQLKLGTDDTGLYFDARIPDTGYGRDLREQLTRGLLTGCSFGFSPGADTFGVAPDGRQLRTHTSIKRLYDVSVVTLPAYDGTDVALRHVDFVRPSLDRRTQLILARHRARTGRPV